MLGWVEVGEANREAALKESRTRDKKNVEEETGC